MTTSINSLGTLQVLINGYQAASAIMAGCELDLFTTILRFSTPPSAKEIADQRALNEQATETLLIALVALEILSKQDDRYQVVDRFASLLDSESPDSYVAMICHLAHCQRSWTQLAWAVKTGFPAPTSNSIRGALADNRNFINGMNCIGRHQAPRIASTLKELGLLTFNHLLDLGGATGTYTLAFLKENPQGRATILDLPIAIGEANRCLASSPFVSRITLTEGDFYKDNYPKGVDLVWIGAIIHQQDNVRTWEMLKKSFIALEPGGLVAIRDVYLNEEKTGPPAAALFGINMLVNTVGGKVYTTSELFQLLENVGFIKPQLAIPAPDMTAVVIARKPK